MSPLAFFVLISLGAFGLLCTLLLVAGLCAAAARGDEQPSEPDLVPQFADEEPWECCECHGWKWADQGFMRTARGPVCMSCCRYEVVGERVGRAA